MSSETNLRALLGSGPIPAEEVREIGYQVADQLSALHAAGLVHGCVCPERILVARAGSNVLVRLAGQGSPVSSGAGVEQDARQTAGAEPVGRQDDINGSRYETREVGSGGAPTSASDVYGFGAVLYLALTGCGTAAIGTKPGRRLGSARSCLTLETPAHLIDVAGRAPPSARRIPQIPPWLWRVVGACLRDDPAARPAASALVNALMPLGSRQGGEASRTATLPADQVMEAESGGRVRKPYAVEQMELYSIDRAGQADTVQRVRRASAIERAGRQASSMQRARHDLIAWEAHPGSGVCISASGRVWQRVLPPGSCSLPVQ